MNLVLNYNLNNKINILIWNIQSIGNYNKKNIFSQIII